MDKLEMYAKEKEQDAEGMVRVIVRDFKRNEMTENSLKQSMRKMFELGHNAGHCRGESYKRKEYTS